jgi:hypothetical protein
MNTPLPSARRYSELRLEQILRTLTVLEQRISERFPDSGLSKVAGQLHVTAVEAGPILERAGRPNLAVRAAVAVAILLVLALVIALVAFLRSQSVDVSGVGGALQVLESAVQDVIFLSLAIYFLFTLEVRLKRRVALRELHRLRSIVHLVDMHQLTKDPEHLFSQGPRTASSPERALTRFQLSRYLDYCTELLSLSSKLAALHVQHLNDPVVLEAVSDIEVLASNLSNKIWQKLVILGNAVRTEGWTGQ